MAVLAALNWPVLECPQLAGFEVSPEVAGCRCFGFRAILWGKLNRDVHPKDTRWMPFLTVSLIIGHTPTKKFEAVVDSGSFTCLFHADIGKAHGLKLKDGLKGDLGGVVGGAKGEVYYHKVKLCIGTHMILINAGFSEKLSVAALLGRHGFFEHFSVLFDRRTIHPGFEITRIYRV
jgi:hypothetical protein